MGEEEFVGERTLVGVNYPENRQRIYSVDEDGEIVGYYQMPGSVYNYEGGALQAQLMDFEVLESGNVLFAMWPKGLYEVNAYGEIVWEMGDDHASHDIDRLDNGDTLIARTWAVRGDKQIVIRDEDGDHVWWWRGDDRYGNDQRFAQLEDEGGAWMHITSVEVIENGVIRAAIRNFNLLVDIDTDGKVINEIQLSSTEGELVETEGGVFGERPHGLETTPDGTLLVATRLPHRVVELNAEGQLLWQFRNKTVKSIRDVDRLPSGNTLISQRNTVVEVDPEGEIVWSWEAPDFGWQSVPMEEVTPIMSVVRIESDGTWSNE